ncbi:maleylpyruvate isomerase family mycothiol-dependent enzyme [Amycolatopsis rubida]|uniref:maleylpyruvate isomerase family mycothiol-dependent enzyme n=1 Tax=Amycolatopsis rubida TaxID=112413 RepID=UPI00142F38ED
MTAAWPQIHAERAALADDLSDAAWSTPSLCEGLSVREVLAHLTAGASLTPLRWTAGVLRCRFDFDRQVAMRLAEHLGDSPADTLARFRRVVTGNDETAVAGRGDARRDRRARRGHPPSARHPPRVSGRDAHHGGPLLPRLRPRRARQRARPRPSPRSNRQ